MPRNVEIKAHIESVEGLVPKVAAIANDGPIDIEQDDTFFRCENGRLKLRVLGNDKGELIYYRRADQQGPKESSFFDLPRLHRNCSGRPYPWHTGLSVACGSTEPCIWSAELGFT